MFDKHIFMIQMEYINRLDFVWKRKLTEEHKEASMTHAVNTILIHNILPMQIGKKSILNDQRYATEKTLYNLT
jgi:adenylate cyclase